MRLLPVFELCNCFLINVVVVFSFVWSECLCVRVPLPVCVRVCIRLE